MQCGFAARTSFRVSEPKLEIRLLGELQVLSNGRLLALPASKKTRALLGYLAATGRSHLRSRLCELLWDGPDDPRAALRWSLNRLRPLVNAAACERLIADREHVELRLGLASLDVGALRALRVPFAEADTHVLRQALAAFHGDFLEGLELPDCPRYWQWCQAERTTLRRTRLTILSALVARDDIDDDARVEYARARVTIEPYDERAHADLVRLLAKLGRNDEALEQYHQCRRVLERELGVKSSSVLDIARAEIRSTARAAAVVATLPGDPAPLTRGEGSLPLIGRTGVLEELLTLANETKRQNAPSVVLLTGEPGIGKTRLLAELARSARAGGVCVLAARAFEMEMVRPYGIWIDAFRSAEGEKWPIELSALLPELAPETQASPVDRARLLEAARHALVRLSRENAGAIVLFDDVQWIDEASAALLHFVARAPAAIALVCAARPGEIEDNAAAVRLVRALRRDGRLTKIALEALDRASTAALVRAVDASVDADRVHAESAGNPLFTIEMARSFARRRSGVPETLRELVGDRIERLDARLRDPLLWAAAFGKGFTLELLARTISIGPAELATILDELVRRGLLALSGRAGIPEYAFCHDIIRQSAYLSLSEPRRRAIHQRIARALAEITPGDVELIGDVAYHAGLAGDAELAARSGLTAAERCQLLFANAEAIALADRALSQSAALPREQALELEIALYKVQVCSGAGRRRRAELENALMRVASEAQSVGSSARAAEALYVLSILHHEGGNFPGAEASILRAAAASRHADPLTKIRSLANAGRCLATIERNMTQAHAMLSEAQALAIAGHLELAEIQWGLGMIRHFEGDHESAVVLLEQALSAARAERDHWAECECWTRLVMIALERTDFGHALDVCRGLAEVAQKMGEGSEAPAAEALEALARFALAEPGAGKRLDSAIAALRHMDAKGLLAYALTFAAQIDLDRGHLQIAQMRLEEAQAAAEAVGRQSLVTIERALQARLAFTRGRVETALALFEEACRGVSSGPLAVSALALAALATTAKLLQTPLPTSIPTRAQTVGN